MPVTYVFNSCNAVNKFCCTYVMCVLFRALTVLILMHLCVQPMEHCVFQNNAVNIYELYFNDEDQSSIVERSSSRTVNVFRDPSAVKRPIQHLSWSPDGGSRIAVTHCNLEFQRAPPDLSTHSYIWEIGKLHCFGIILLTYTIKY